MLQDRCPPETPQNNKIMTLERAKGKGMGWKEEREKGRKKEKSIMTGREGNTIKPGRK